MINEKELLSAIAKTCPECYGIVAKAVKAQPAIEAPRWTPVAKELPTIGELVLVQFNDTRSDIMIAELVKYEVDEDWWVPMWRTQEMRTDYDVEDVVAWQELPALYGGEQE